MTRVCVCIYQDAQVSNMTYMTKVVRLLLFGFACQAQ